MKKIGIASFSILAAQYIFACLWVTASLFYIEAGAYMSEIREFGYPSGAASAYIFSMLFFFIIALISFTIAQTVNINKSNIAYRIGDYKLSTSRIYSILKITLYPSLLILAFITSAPLISGLDRNVFWSSNAIGIQRILFNQLPLIAFVGGYIAIKKENGITLKEISKHLLPVFLLQITYGETFTGIFTATVFFLIPICSEKRGIETLKNNKLAILTTIISAAAALLAYKFLGKYVHGIGSGTELMMNRVLALQGQVWWAIYTFGDQLSNGDYEGIRLLMYKISPSEVFNAYSAQGVNFTMGYPAILISEFDKSWLIIHTFFALGFGAILGILRKLISKNKFFSSIIFIKIYSAYYVFITNGEIQDVISFKSLFYIVAASLILYLERSRSVRFSIKAST
ncbi:MAG: hypothetical protein I8H93_19080 [Pseudomonadales bacterium]|nr:hypothetical protein [Pseudomonadales bacterium]MBH2078099.1 hypothetical protein [Pseudomonadales bacterium]